MSDRPQATSKPAAHAPGAIHIKETPVSIPKISLLNVMSQPLTKLTAAPAITELLPHRGSRIAGNTITPNVAVSALVDLLITS